MDPQQDPAVPSEDDAANPAPTGGDEPTTPAGGDTGSEPTSAPAEGGDLGGGASEPSAPAEGEGDDTASVNPA